MTIIEIVKLWNDFIPMSIAIWLIFIITILYFAKSPMYLAIRSLCTVLHDGLLQMSKSFIVVSTRLKERNREVLLSAGMSNVERHIEHEFSRVNTAIERDLSGFPVLKRQLLEQISKIDEDYHQSSNIPPNPPEWIEAVESLASLPSESNGNKAVANILKEIHNATASQHKSAMEEYKKVVAAHHSALNKLMPYWRKVTKTLDVVGKTFTSLQERATQIDNRMDEYKDILSKSDKAERILSSSSMTQFFISGLVLAIAIAGAVINFNLIALPMSEMVGGGSYIGNYKTSDVAALVIILVEVAMGLYLMESLRFTRLFPVIGQMDDKMRRKMMYITLVLLIILAGIESSLALMRDQIALNNQALLQTLSGNEPVIASNSMIPTIGQMVLGFILPFILTFVAIPLESFIHSSRTVLGVLSVGFLQLISFPLDLLAKIILNTGELLVNIYNIMIFPALWVEELALNKFKNGLGKNDGKKLSPKNNKNLTLEKIAVPSKEVSI